MATKIARQGSIDEVGEALSFCIVLLQQECSGPQELHTALETLLKILRNVQSHPTEEKYKCLKKENHTFSERVWCHTGAQQFLVAAGWSEVDDTVVLLEDKYLDTAIAVLEENLSQVPAGSGEVTSSRSARQYRNAEEEEKERILEENKRKQREQFKKDQAERRRIAEQIKADRREANSRESRDSHARVLNPGSAIHKFEDIGVDLNKGGG